MLKLGRGTSNTCVCKMSGSNSKKRRGHWHLKEFRYYASSSLLGTWKIGYYGDALSSIFLLLCLASNFSHFLIIPVCMFFFFVFLCLCSSHLLSASTYFIVRVISARVICIQPGSSRNSPKNSNYAFTK